MMTDDDDAKMNLPKPKATSNVTIANEGCTSETEFSCLCAKLAAQATKIGSRGTRDIDITHAQKSALGVM